jgi:hypothetical protein
MGWYRLIQVFHGGLHVTIDELKKTINALTQEIVEKASQDQFDDIDSRIDRRNEFMTLLIARSPNEISHDDLSSYLKNIMQSDQHVAEIITEQRNLIKKTLLSFDNLREYSNV